MEDQMKEKIRAKQALFQMIKKKRWIHRTHRVLHLYRYNCYQFYQKVNSIKSSQNFCTGMLIVNAVGHIKMMFGPILMMTSSVVRAVETKIIKWPRIIHPTRRFITIIRVFIIERILSSHWAPLLNFIMIKGCIAQ